MKRKILYVITKSNWGGAQRYVFDLATSLPNSANKGDFEAVVAAGGTGPLLSKLAEASVRVIPIKSLQRDMSILSDAASLLELYRICRAERPQVVHVNSSKAGGLGAFAARVAGVPRVVFTCHGWAFNEERGLASRAAIRFFSWLTVMLCHYTIAVSRRDFIDGRRMPLCAGRISLVHNGIAAPQFKTREMARGVLSTVGKMSGIEFPRDSLLFGAIGELHKNKGYEYMIRAFAIARKSRNFPYRLIVMGEGEEKARLKQLIRELELETDIVLMGNVDNAASFLPACDAFTLTSINEGLPYTMIEAGFAGLPVVATNVGGVKEMIEDMKTGILVQTRKPDDIAQGLLLLAKDPERALTYGAALKEKVQSEFSLEQMVEKTVEVYRGI
jgi:glycosyltransferase involved in cell wall biosynthesis